MFIDNDSLLRHIAQVWDEFLNGFYLVHVDSVTRSKIYVGVNDLYLDEAIRSAQIDMDRWAQFHNKENGERPDRHKFAGFVSKWIAKVRPVYFRVNDSSCELSETIHYLNDAFAILIFQSFLKKRMPSKMVGELLYRFHFRDVAPEMLALLAYCCEQMPDPEIKYARAARGGK